MRHSRTTRTGIAAGSTMLLLSTALAVAATPTHATTDRPDPGSVFASSPVARVMERAAGEDTMIFSRESNTGYHDIFTGLWHLLTGQRIGYVGASDGSSPRVGEVYQGISEFYNYGNPVDAEGYTTLTVEVALPPGTKPSVDPSDPTRRIQCFWFEPASGSSGEFTGGRYAGNACPTSLTPGGRHGHRLLPATHSGQFRLPPGIGFAVIYPLVSSETLAGYGGVPDPHCLVGALTAGGGGTPDGRVWDAPTTGEQCPLPQYHGADVPVLVAAKAGTGGGNTAPSITRLRPAKGTTVRKARPRIRAVVADAETDLTRKRIRLFIDGRRVKRFTYDRGTDVLRHRTRVMDQGRHRVVVVARDGQGGVTKHSTTFRVVR